MNPNTGELGAPRFIDSLTPEERAKFEPVPDRHRAEAERTLAGRESARVDLAEPSGLSWWAKALREREGGKASQRRLRQRERALAKGQTHG